MANGWTVHKSETDEAYDILATDPLTGEHKRIQCKTIKLRDDRRNEMVIYARKGSGEPYAKSDADYIVGVLVTEGAPPRVWMFENRGIGEYWASQTKAAERWVELSIALNRSIYEVETEAAV
jgi:hypothetical protein